MAKAKKLPSGNWRVQVYAGEENGNRKYKSFTAKSGKFLVPTEVTGTFVTTQVDESMLTYNGGHLSNADIDTARNFFAWNAGRTTPYTGTYTVTITTDGGSYAVPFKIVGEGKIEGDYEAVWGSMSVDQ